METATSASQVSLWQLNLLRIGVFVMGGGLAVINGPCSSTTSPGALRKAPRSASDRRVSVALPASGTPWGFCPSCSSRSGGAFWLGVVALPFD